MKTPTEVVNAMYSNDAFINWLGIERIKDGTGISVLKMQVRKEMTNSFGIAHGGITYSLADSALAYASNAHGRMSVSIETSISHTIACIEGDTLTTRVEEVSLSNKIGVYNIYITNQKEQIVAVFKGTVYRTSKEWQ